MFSFVKKSRKNNKKEEVVDILWDVFKGTWKIIRRITKGNSLQDVNIPAIDVFCKSGIGEIEKKSFSQIFEIFQRFNDEVERTFTQECPIDNESEHDLFVAACEVLRVAKRIDDDGKNFSVVIQEVKAAEREWQRKLASYLNKQGVVNG